jgi:DNA-binding NtrC family response regulator
MNWLKKLRHFDAIRVLAVMGKDADAQALQEIADKANWHLGFAANYESALEHLQREEYSVILCDRDWMSDPMGWCAAVQKLVAASPHGCVILTSTVKDDRLWQELTELGGYDVLIKPFQPEKVTRSIEFAWSHLKTRRQPTKPVGQCR